MGPTEPQLRRRRRLVEALRVLPDEGDPDGYTAVPGDGDFKWAYNTTHLLTECGSVGCALGLGHALGLLQAPYLWAVQEALGLGSCEARRIFYEPGTYGFPRPADGERPSEETARWYRVTPRMVADVLERTYL